MKITNSQKKKINQSSANVLFTEETERRNKR